MMSKNYKDLSRALSAVYQSALMVHDIARGQKPNAQDFNQVLNSVLMTNPQSVDEIYPMQPNLNHGQKALMLHVHPKKMFQAPQILRYVFDLLYLAKKLKRNKKLSKVLTQKLSQTQQKLHHFSITDRNVVEQLGDIYLETVSTLPYRIQVMGRPGVIQAPFNAKKIRAVLLGGIRAAFLWYQLGGSRIHYYTRKDKYCAALEDLLCDGSDW